MSDRNDPSFNGPRRKFLLTLGLAAGAAAVSPSGLMFGRSLTGITQPEASLRRMPRISILLPAGSTCVYSGAHFTSGFNCYLDELRRNTGVKTTIAVEEYGMSPHQALIKASALVESNAFDILVSPLNAGLAARLHPLLERHALLFMNTDAGANVVRDSEQNRFIVNNSLSHWQATMALGRHAVEQYGGKVMISSSLYESGYDALYAFRLGVEEAGGTVIETHVTHGASTQSEMKTAVDQITQARPDVVCAMYGREEAGAFLTQYSQSSQSKQIPLVTSAFTLDDALVRSHTSSIEGIRTCSAWLRDIDTKQNQLFLDHYERYAHHQANAFSVLGYDTARLIAEAVRGAGGRTDAAALAETITDVRFESPRGTLGLDARTRSVETPLYLCAMRGGERVVIESVQHRGGAYQSIASLKRMPRSGFSYTYLTA